MINVNIDKAKTIAHDMRRSARADAFAPLDEIIMKHIPGGSAASAEDGRQAIREKYAAIQESIDAAVTPEEIKAALEDAGIL